MIKIEGLIGNENGQYSLLRLIEDVKKETDQSKIYIMIDSPGGDGDLAFQMFDYLRSTGKFITTECAGNCASAASILFLAGDYRICGCPIMIHNPFVELQGDAATLSEAADWIGKFERKVEKFYEQRTNLDAAVLSSLMSNETYITPLQAVSLGFANQSKNIAKALITNNIKTSKIIKMNKKEKKSLLVRLAEAILDNGELKMLDLTAVDGTVVTIERDSGLPQVGDNATPDGVFDMPDGTEITIINGMIAEIDTEGVDGGAGEMLKAENAKLKEELKQLKEQLTKTDGLVKTTEEMAQLNAIKIAGGTKWLESHCSHYKPSLRKSDSQMKEKIVEAGIGGKAAEELAALIEKNSKR